MAKENIASSLMKKCEPIVNELGYDLVDVEYVKEGPQWYLRFYIDNEPGIGLDDCQEVSKKVNQLIDELDPIEGNYILEVSSPGLERVLKREKDFQKNIDKKVEIKLYKSFENKKNYVGNLIEVTNEIIKIKETDTDLVVELERKNVSQVKTIFEFNM